MGRYCNHRYWITDVWILLNIFKFEDLKRTYMLAKHASTKKEKLWFKQKIYGWGWIPSSWEGWTVTAVICLYVLWTGFYYQEKVADGQIGGFIISLSCAIIALIMVCKAKGETPRWRWG
ncbi:MAG: hypothetical protein ACI8Y7_000250 [Candidatus Woesearchaeota archaeon]